MNSLQKLIITYDVSNLSLARYYAAQGVDFIIIDLDQRIFEDSIELITQFKEWIEGPTIIGMSSDLEKLEIFKTYSDINLILKEDLLFSKEKLKESIQNIINIKYPDLNLELFPFYKLHFIRNKSDVDIPHSSIVYLIFAEKEEKTGIYNFEVLDSIFEEINK
ncbi:MAG: hypothetical protein ABIO44_13090 [Saprospiraceae bacterium]